METPSTQPKTTRRRTLLIVIAVVLLAGAGIAAYRHWGGGEDASGGEGGGGKRGFDPNKPQPVSVGQVTVQDIRLWVTAIGTATPRNLVTIHSRVDGELMRLHFNEGETVKQGQLLAELDPRPFEAQLAQANGQLARDKALLQNAKVDLDRYRDLWAKDSIAKQQVDTQVALVQQYEGTVQNDKGVVDNAKLQLDYTRITAPVSGTIGLRQVDPGNQVHASDTTGLATIAQVEPMTVIFAVPETQLPEINRRLVKGEKLAADAWDRDQKNRLASGRLLTADNQIDATTGTIKLRAEFPNADHALFPNQFVNIRLLLGMREKVTAVPSAALQRGSKGTFVFAVNGDGTVRSVPVTAGAVDGDLLEIQGDLAAGGQVVLEGSDKLRDGSKVSVIEPGSQGGGGGGGGKHRRNGAESQAATGDGQNQGKPASQAPGKERQGG